MTKITNPTILAGLFVGPILNKIVKHPGLRIDDESNHFMFMQPHQEQPQ